jgi:hypothetical protein
MSDNPFDKPSMNPRYKGATPQDVARALLLPLDPELRAKRLAAWKAERRSVRSGKVSDVPSRVNSRA